ncbi:S49 family peptidase [Candidatus Accumulibacter phosphatis]|uniref:S49 family peptidase n=1 Tax=Candidatus Accumulibacter phosphatis TaxID=327160 RepID=A0ABX1U0Q7_9PROT|nr:MULTISPECIES: S49 family peptidase [Candidatus Accumulibacter]NMQ28555.1 S49 family peptidase [Candidatus Accumulibacter phosphatis]
MLQEQRVKRRWGIFFKLIGFSYLLAMLLLFIDWGGGSEKLVNGKHTALVHLNGTIASGGEGSAESINDALRSAFDDKETAGVVLRVNSPGGSPVQAGIVHDEIRRLRSKHPQISLYVVVEDLCASGGYYVAVAADKIFVDKASIVGSIGVLMDGFGFTGTMDKLGVERRLLTAGVNKGFLDPFSPQDAEQKKHAQVLLGEIHRQFIEVVRKGRGERLKETPEMFSGLMWTGTQSIQLGLADDLGTVESVAREVIKAERIVDFTIKENIAERFAKRLRADAAQGAGSLLGAIDWSALR